MLCYTPFTYHYVSILRGIIWACKKSPLVHTWADRIPGDAGTWCPFSSTLPDLKGGREVRSESRPGCSRVVVKPPSTNQPKQNLLVSTNPFRKICGSQNGYIIFPQIFSGWFFFSAIICSIHNHSGMDRTAHGHEITKQKARSGEFLPEIWGESIHLRQGLIQIGRFRSFCKPMSKDPPRTFEHPNKLRCQKKHQKNQPTWIHSFEICWPLVSFFEPVSEVLVVELDPPELFASASRFQCPGGQSWGSTTMNWLLTTGIARKAFQDTLVIKSKAECSLCRGVQKKTWDVCRSIKLSVKQKNSPI